MHSSHVKSCGEKILIDMDRIGKSYLQNSQEEEGRSGERGKRWENETRGRRGTDKQRDRQKRYIYIYWAEISSLEATSRSTSLKFHPSPRHQWSGTSWDPVAGRTNSRTNSRACCHETMKSCSAAETPLWEARASLAWAQSSIKKGPSRILLNGLWW